MMVRKYAPRDLQVAGRRLWREVVAAYPDLTIGETLLLIEAARTADLCDKLNTASQKPTCPRATLVELRQQRQSLAALINELGI